MAAAIFAGVKVVVVDIAQADPALDIEALQAAISDNTLAIIAVNFLGIREQLTELKQWLAQHPRISLIEDNAQWFPDAEEFSELTGDAVGRQLFCDLYGAGNL